MKTRLILTVALAGVFLNGAAAYAQTTWYSRTSADWNTASTWESGSCDSGNNDGSVPGTDDDVVICVNDTVTVTTATNSVDTVTVDSGGTLSMEASCDLRIQETLTVNDTCRFNADDTETQPILRAMEGALSISGTITVTDPAGTDGGAGGQCAADDEVNDWMILTSTGQTTAQYGPLDITSDIEIDGVVLANGSSADYRTRITGAILTGSTGRIEASGDSAALVQLNTGSSFSISDDLDFRVANGAVIEFNDTGDFVTGGGFEMVTGKFKFPTGATGTFNGTY